MRGRLKSLSLSLALLGALAVGPVTASPAAAAGGCTSTTSGGTVTIPPTISGGTIEISQTVHVITGKYCPGSPTSNDSSWTPPACWWAPVFTPQALKDYAYANFVNASSADLTWQRMLEYYETDGGKGETTPAGYLTTAGPPYSNWNINSSPDGMWWSLVFNVDMIGTPQFGDCLNRTLTSDGEPWSWVPNASGGPTNVTGPTITAGELALYEASMLQLPASDFSSDPTAGQTVNLPTWVWAGNAATGTFPYAPQQLGLCTYYPLNAPVCATVTATATTFTIDPGTPNNAADALVYDSGNGCAVNANGTVGTPYAGQPGLPPCGLTYLHSTPGNTLYYPSVTVKWSVTWDGGGADWPKTDTMPGAVHQMTVQEIQSIVGH